MNMNRRKQVNKNLLRWKEYIVQKNKIVWKEYVNFLKKRKVC